MTVVLNNPTISGVTAGLGTSVSFDVGTGPDDIVQLDGTAKLPAVDGSQLTNLPGGGATDIDGLSDAATDYPSGNMFLGDLAGANFTATATEDTALGQEALGALTDGLQNTAVGSAALASITTGDACTAVGASALLAATGSNNTAIGRWALTDTSTGDSNTAIGYNSLATNTTGIGNTGLGAGADVGASGLTNAMALGFGTTVAASNTVQIGNDDITDVYFGDETAILHGDGSALTNLPASAPAFRGAVVYGTGTQSIPASTDTVVNFTGGTATIDTDSIWNSATKLIVPTGVTRIRLAGKVLYAAGGTLGDAMLIKFHKNGSQLLVPGLPNGSMLFNGTALLGVDVESPTLVVTAGDEFELVTTQLSAGAIDIHVVYSWFTMEIVE
jgi:hypothetical protein